MDTIKSVLKIQERDMTGTTVQPILFNKMTNTKMKQLQEGQGGITEDMQSIQEVGEEHDTYYDDDEKDLEPDIQEVREGEE